MNLWRTLSYYIPCPPILVLIGISTAIFAVELGSAVPWAMEWGAVPLFITQAWNQVLAGELGWGAGWGAIHAFLTLITAVFLHGDAEHLLYNMVFLWIFGSLCAELLGYTRTFLLFFFLGACGNIAQTLLNPGSPIPIVGASGAILGFEGLYLGLAMVWTLRWPDVWPLARPIPPMQLGLFAIIGVVFDAFSLMNHAQGVAYGAHLGGFLTGLFMARLITLRHPTHEQYLFSNPQS